MIGSLQSLSALRLALRLLHKEQGILNNLALVSLIQLLNSLVKLAHNGTALFRSIIEQVRYAKPKGIRYLADRLCGVASRARLNLRQERLRHA